MDDRCSDVLYLELGNTSDEASAAEEPGGSRLPFRRATVVTWWENCVPERTDLPMRIPM